MNRLKPFHLFIGLLLMYCLFPQLISAQEFKSKQPVRIIFDTDMGPDYDDVGAIAILHALADSGKCTILATMACNKHKKVAATLSVLNTYFNRPNLPIGVVNGDAVNIGASQKWDSLLVVKYPHRINLNEEVPDALTLYRKILAKQPDKSVTIVSVGFFTNLADLLNSGPDKYSKLNGKALVEKKVARLVSMAGRFDQEMGEFKEFNVVKDAKAAKFTFDNWPTPIIFSGFEIGAVIHTGLPVANSTVALSPVKDVFALSIPLDPNDSKGRMSWDETAVLVAINGITPYFDTTSGVIVGKEDGTNNWDSRGSRDAFLVKKMPVIQMEKILNDLILHQPISRKK